jgi:hypothetical protein
MFQKWIFWLILGFSFLNVLIAQTTPQETWVLQLFDHSELQ